MLRHGTLLCNGGTKRGGAASCGGGGSFVGILVARQFASWAGALSIPTGAGLRPSRIAPVQRSWKWTWSPQRKVLSHKLLSSMIVGWRVLVSSKSTLLIVGRLVGRRYAWEGWGECLGLSFVFNRSSQKRSFVRTRTHTHGQLFHQPADFFPDPCSGVRAKGP